MNAIKTLQAVAIATAMLANHTVTADESDYKMIDVSQDVTKLLTAALADNAAYDKGVSQRVCFITIEQIKQKTVSDGTKYKFDIKGCSVDAGATSAGQCATTCTPVVDFEIKIVKHTASGALQIKDIDRDNDSNNDNDDDDHSDSSDSDDKTAVSTPTASSTGGVTATNGTASSTSGTAGATTTTTSMPGAGSSSTSASSTATTTTPSTSTNVPTPKPTVKSGAAASVIGASAFVLATAATALAL